MPHYDTPPTSWEVKLPHKPVNLRTKSRLKIDGGCYNVLTGQYTTDRVLQQGVEQYTRKKKNGCRLVSTRVMRCSINKTADPLKIEVHPCGAIWRPIPL